MTEHGLVISGRKSRVLSGRILRPGIRVDVGGTSTVSGSRRIIPNSRSLGSEKIN